MQKLASTGPMPWDPSKGWAGTVGRWAREVLGGSQRGNPAEPAAPDPSQHGQESTPPPLVEGTEINWGWIDDREKHLGRGDLDGYVPKRKGIPRQGSGVTVAKGVDLGSRSVASLEKLGLSPEIVRKLSPYVGLKGMRAAAALKDEKGREKPIGLTPAEAKAVSDAVRRDELSRIARRFNADSQVGRFEGLPANAQTVIASVYYHLGSYAMPETPKFWGAITRGDWPAAHDELKDFGGGFDPRRDLEAGLLQEDIKAGRLPVPPKRAP